jgi:probable HAF family extracellular repeat protein
MLILDLAARPTPAIAVIAAILASCGTSKSDDGATTAGQGGAAVGAGAGGAGAGGAGAGGGAGKADHDAGALPRFLLLEPDPTHVLQPGEALADYRWSTSIVALSGDATVVAGLSEFWFRSDAGFRGGAEALRWTAATGAVGLGFLPGLDFAHNDAVDSAPQFMSSDGSVVLGDTGIGPPARLYRWSAATGMADIGPVLEVGWQASGDGSVVAGNVRPQAMGPYQALRWSAATGWIHLGTLPGDTESMAYKVSTDGSVVVGYSGNAFGAGKVFRYTAASGMVSLGNLPGSSRCSPFVMTPDASVVGGECDQANSRVFRWSAATGTQLVPGLGSSSVNMVGCVSADGTVIGGDSIDAMGTSHAFRWTEASGTVAVALDGSTNSSLGYGACRVSADGKVMIGTAGSQSFRWTESKAALLAPLPGDQRSVAMNLSSDGSVVTGSSSRRDDGGSVDTAVYWDTNGNVHSVADELSAAGVELRGFQLTYAFGKVAGGRVVLYGDAERPGERRGWVAWLP